MSILRLKMRQYFKGKNIITLFIYLLKTTWAETLIQVNYSFLYKKTTKIY